MLENERPSMVRHRINLHEQLARRCLWVKPLKTIEGIEFPVISNADANNPASVVFASRVAEQLPPAEAPHIKGSAMGRAMESVVFEYLTAAIADLGHLAPWSLKVGGGRVISEFAQYAHLSEVQAAIRMNPELELTFGGDYLVKPDLVVSRLPLSNEDLNRAGDLVDEREPNSTSPTRGRGSAGSGLELLHASVSCKWSLRSDRAQNARTESLNLIRNRKGHLPHIVLVTMEPLPSRLSSIAIGTGDLDCVYHCALWELIRAVEMAADRWGPRWANYRAQLDVMVRGGRLRDIGDLPFDLLG